MINSANVTDDNIFLYTTEEFSSLQQANIATSIISLVSSTLVTLVYIYMLIYHRKKANRVSLRCVFLCCLSEALSSIMSIVVTTDKLAHCNAANIVLGFSSIFSSAVLTVVGLNLFLIFVINVKRRDFLEKFYYPAVVVYSLIGALAPIYRHIRGDSPEYEDYTCWFVTYVQVRSYNDFPYIWFYVFIFFINTVAVICSLVAMMKLLREQRRIRNKLNSITSLSKFTHKNGMNRQSKQSSGKTYSSVLTKVVLRCTIYPLVPFISDIFGFVMELIIYGGHTPSFTLAMFDVVFSKIEGFLVSIVFFSDPAVTAMMGEGYKRAYQKYVVEYTFVELDKIEKVEVQSDCDQGNSLYSSSLIPPHSETSSSIENNLYLQALPSAAKNSRHSQDLFVKRAQVSSPNSVGKKEMQTHQKKSNKPKTIAMRKMCNVVNDSDRGRVYDRMSTPRLSANVSVPSLLTVGEINVGELAARTSGKKEVFVPYRYPFLATWIHRVMCHWRSERATCSPRKDNESLQRDIVEGSSTSTAVEENGENTEGQTSYHQAIGSHRSSVLISKY